MHTHWVDQARTRHTDTDLRLLHDQGHDPHPEQAEHRRQAPVSAAENSEAHS